MRNADPDVGSLFAVAAFVWVLVSINQLRATLSLRSESYTSTIWMFSYFKKTLKSVFDCCVSLFLASGSHEGEAVFLWVLRITPARPRTLPPHRRSLNIERMKA